MKKRIAYFLLFSGVLLVGCKNRPAEVSNVFSVPLTDKRLPSLDNLFGQVWFVPLETTGESIFGDFRKIVFDDQYIYIQDHNKITVFDKDGRWLRNLSHQGRGPQEYYRITDFVVDGNRNVFILDNNTRQVLKYSVEDRFLEEFSYDDNLWALEMDLLGDSVFALAGMRGSSDYRLNFFDARTFEKTGEYWPLNKRALYFADSYFTTFEGRSLFHEMANNHIYEITPDSMTIRYTIDIGGSTPPDGFWDQQGKDQHELLAEYQTKRYIDLFNVFCEGPETILLHFQGMSRETPQGYALIDKSTGDSFVFDEIDFGDGFSWSPEYSKYITVQSDGWLVIYMPAHALVDEGGAFRQRFPDLQESDNGVLCIAKLR